MKAAAQRRLVPILLTVAVLGATGGVAIALAPAAFGAAGMNPTRVASSSRAAPASVHSARGAAARRPDRRPRRLGVVRIQNFKFAPARVTIPVGTTVTWTNKDVVGHTVNFHAAGINSPSVLNQGDTFSHTFTTPGTYTYICDIHPFMHGTVVVTG